MPKCKFTHHPLKCFQAIIMSLMLCFLPDTVSFADELHSVSAASVSSLDGLMDRVRSVLSEELVHQVGACYHFQITTESGQTNNYFVDLTQGKTEAPVTPPATFVAVCR